MKLLVLLRPVRDPASFNVNRKAQKIFINREAFIVNPADRNALEAALALAGADDSVTVIALGGEPARDALQMARAAGASRALLVPDAGPLDAAGLTHVLQAAIAHLGEVDLVLLGAEVLDADTAQAAPRLAAALDWPFVESAFQATRLPEGGLALTVAAEAGYKLVGIDLPAVATIARDSNQPRFAPAANIITIYSDPQSVETLSLADLGLAPESLLPATTARGESFPPERTLGRLLDGDEAIQQIVQAIRAH